MSFLGRRKKMKIESVKMKTENWKTVRLGDVFDLQMGKTPDRKKLDYFQGSHKWISIADISKSEKYISETKECLTDEAITSSGIKSIPKDTVIMSFKLSIGKTAITSDKMYSNEAIMAFLPNGKYETDNSFLYHLFSNKDWSEGSNKAVKGITLNKASLSEVKISLPPLEIQKQIAAQLDKCTSIIAKHKLMLEKYDTLIKSRFIEMFGDPVQNPFGWENNQLSDFIIFLTSGSRGWSEYFSQEGELFLTIKNVKNSKINLNDVQHVKAPSNKEAERTKVQENDLLISITADLGRTGVVSKKIASYGAYINQHLSLVRLDTHKINPLFVSYYLETDGGKIQFLKKNQSAVKAGLNFDAIKSLRFINPPLNKQNDFVYFVQQIDKSKFAVQKSLEKAELLYKSLMQEYFG